MFMLFCSDDKVFKMFNLEFILLVEGLLDCNNILFLDILFRFL